MAAQTSGPAADQSGHGRRTRRRATAVAPEVVCEAEQIVRNALMPELLRECDRLAAAECDAHRRCQDAYRNVSIAQNSGDPRRISEAQLALERALLMISETSAARDQAGTVLRSVSGPMSRARTGRALAGFLRLLRSDKPLSRQS